MTLCHRCYGELADPPVSLGAPRLCEDCRAESDRAPRVSSIYVCPVCGRRAPTPAALCSGSFLDTDHPSNVPPVAGEPPVGPDGS